MEGYIKLYRQLIESQVFANSTALKIWIWCLLKASRKERFSTLKIGKGEITIKILPGQFIFGRFKAEEELNIDGSSIYRWIKKFESKEFKMISIQANNQYSIISICNWVNYQSEIIGNEQPTNNQRATNEQPTNTDKNVKNVKKRESINFLPPTIPDIENYFSEKIKETGVNLNPKIEAIKFDSHYGSKNWMVGKSKMSNWKKAISGWLARNEESILTNHLEPKEKSYQALS